MKCGGCYRRLLGGGGCLEEALRGGWNGPPLQIHRPPDFHLFWTPAPSTLERAERDPRLKDLQ
jgi:hypothetical protein